MQIDSGFIDVDEGLKKALEAMTRDGERLLWVGRPNLKKLFNRADIYYIAVGLVFFVLGFEWIASLAETNARTGGRPDLSNAMWSIPAILIGVFLVFGRVAIKYQKKKKTYYLITNLRAAIMYKDRPDRNVNILLEDVPEINKTVRKDGAGTLRFGTLQLGAAIFENSGMDFMVRMNRLGSKAMSFFDINDIDKVYKIAIKARSSSG